MTPSRKFKLEWAELEPWGGPDDSIVENPTTGDIEALLTVLARAEDGFVILASDDETYIQAAAPRDPGGPLTIEHRAGSADAHFAIDEKIFGAPRMKALFLAFHTNPASIGKAAKWRKLDL